VLRASNAGNCDLALESSFAPVFDWLRRRKENFFILAGHAWSP